MSNHTKKILERDSQKGSSQLLLTSTVGIASYSDTLPVPIADLQQRKGWYYSNTAGAGTRKLNLYFWSSTPESSPVTLSELKSMFAVITCDDLSDYKNRPFFAVYTKPTGVNDAGAWFHSRCNFTTDSADFIGAGEEIVMEVGENDYASLHRTIKCKKDFAFCLGDQRPEEEILLISLQTDSSAPAGKCQVLVETLGTQLGKTKDSSYKYLDLVTSQASSSVEITSSVLPTGAATETTLSTLDGKITACNTGAVVVSGSALPTGAATETTLSTLDGKITACNTGSVTVSSSALPSGAATQLTLASVDGKITQGYDQTIAIGGDGLQQVAIYGQNGSGALHMINTDTQGHLKTTQQDREITRNTGTITDDFSGSALLSSIGVGVKTAYWDLQNYDKFFMYITTSAMSGSLILQGSHTTSEGDFRTLQEIYVTSTDGSNYEIKHEEQNAYYRYYRLLNSGTSILAFSEIRINYLK